MPIGSAKLFKFQTTNFKVLRWSCEHCELSLPDNGSSDKAFQKWKVAGVGLEENTKSRIKTDEANPSSNKATVTMPGNQRVD